MKKRKNIKLIFTVVIILLICMVSINIGIDNATGKVFWRSGGSSFLSKLRFWSPTPVRAPTIAQCFDSDGDNPNKVGYVKLGNEKQLDFCSTSGRRERDENRFKVSSCSGNSCYVNEYICYNNRVTSKKVKCENGCSNGACLKKIKESCIDTDEGKDHLKQGTIIVTYESGYKRTETDSCNKDGTLREWYCGEPGDPAGLLRSENYVKCPSGTLCKEGICVEEVITILKSNYFGSDETALGIVNEEIINYKFSDLYMGGNTNLFADINVNAPNKFQYKVLSALKMLGYALSATSYKPVLINWAEAFQKKNNLPISDTITTDFIKKLDELLYEQENQILPYLNSFPINEDFDIDSLDVHVIYVSHNQNEPPKDHVRFFFSYLMSSLPRRIAPLTKESVYRFFAGQGHGIIYYEDYQHKLNYIPSAPPLNKQGSGIYKTSKSQLSDAMGVSNFLHEYGHQIDGLLYGSISPEAGMINTETFYGLLYDMNDCPTGSIWKTCAPLSKAKFVSDYALSWENPNNPGHYSIVEAFAESFAMYVLQGKLYRKLATIDPSYQLQYNWLKQNVFDGIEYCTGDENMIVFDKWNTGEPQWDYTKYIETNDKIYLPRVSSIMEEFVYSKVSNSNPIFSLYDLVTKC